MSGLEVVGDITGMWQESAQNVATGMSGLGADELGSTTQAFADALDILGGTAQVISVMASVAAARNTLEIPQIATAAAALATNPFTWAWLAIALAAGTATAAFAYGISREYTLKANLSNPSESLATAITAGVLA